MNNSSFENHKPTLEQKLTYFFSNEQAVHTEGRVIEHLSLGNIAQFEQFRREFPLAVFQARKTASENFELPEDFILDTWFSSWVNGLVNRGIVIERVKELGFDEHDPAIFLTFDLRLEKVEGPYAIDIDVSLTSQDKKYLNKLPVVLSFVRVKLLVERDLKG